jgi:hypothetical protein
MRKKTQKEFISEVKKIHDDKYDFSESIYITNNTPLKVICPVHGVFFKKPVHLINRKQGCPKCSQEKQTHNQKKPLDILLKEFNHIHDNKYNYSKVEYVNTITPITIICPKHGEFEQLPSNHLKGKGCKYCGGTAKMDTKLFIEKSKKIHDNKYDYSKVVYKSSREPVTIICPEHGEFEQIPNNHLSKSQGCPKCLGWVKDTESFIEKSKKIHGDKYDYKNTTYKTIHEEVDIICPTHGNIKVTPNYHLRGLGCKFCTTSISIEEKNILTFIESMGVKCIPNDRSVLGDKELDIYLPDYNIAIEYNGLYWHSEEYVDNEYHLNKSNKCLEKNVRLIHIFEDEWLHKKEIVKSRIINILNLTPKKIYGRKCVIKEVDSNVARNFINENHIQGYVNSSIKIGLFYDNNLVSIMTLGKTRNILKSKGEEGEYEILRFCNKLNTTIIGGASKIFNYFLKTYKPKKVISYSDKRWSIGNLYNKLNFKLENTSKPNYFYLINKKRETRYKYQKHKLKSLGLLTNPSLSAVDNMKINGFYRIFDCGTDKFIWDIKN